MGTSLPIFGIRQNSCRREFRERSSRRAQCGYTFPKSIHVYTERGVQYCERVYCGSQTDWLRCGYSSKHQNILQDWVAKLRDRLGLFQDTLDGLRNLLDLISVLS